MVLYISLLVKNKGINIYKIFVFPIVTSYTCLILMANLKRIFCAALQAVTKTKSIIKSVIIIRIN